MIEHLPSSAIIAAWPEFTEDRPLCILVSGCLAGNPVGYDGSTYGLHPHVTNFMLLRNVKTIVFCPENFSFGTPRELCNIHDGDGYDVLAGHARVLTENGSDWTDGMIAAAKEMLRLAKTNEIDLAVLMDISAACGSQVIYKGRSPENLYQSSQGVCAALLVKNGIPVVSQRDFKTLDLIFCKLDQTRVPNLKLRDHHETDWYLNYFSLCSENRAK